jgi:protein ImuB
MRRLGCLYVEHFVAAAHARTAPGIARESPLAVVSGTPPARRVLDANRAARAGGVVPGITETEARARCTRLTTRTLSEECMAAARQALLDSAYGVSPRLEDGGPGVVYADLDGLRTLFGNDAAVAARLVNAARRVGLAATAGVADTRAAAHVAARVATRIVVIPPGEDRASLAPVPLAAIDVPDALAQTFVRWGVRTLGELAALSRDALLARAGRAALHVHDIACAVDRAPVRPWEAPAFWEEAQQLDWELTSWPALAPVLERVLERLVARLDVAHLAADALRVDLELATGGTDERLVAFSHPLREVKPVLALVAHDIEARPPDGPVVRVAASARAVRPASVQSALWQRPVPAGRDLAATLARLAILVGVEHVGSPVTLDSHRPDAVALVPFAPPAGEARAPMSGESSPVLAFRRLRPPRIVEVETSGDEPARVRLTDRAERVVACVGPWRTSGEWWDDGAWARDEWDVALRDGMLCRLARDLRTGAWFLDGAYD